MVDAEHSYFQPAIDHAAMELQRTYNRQKPTVLNTYQCYLQVCRSWSLLRSQFGWPQCCALLSFHKIASPLVSVGSTTSNVE